MFEELEKQLQEKLELLEKKETSLADKVRLYKEARQLIAQLMAIIDKIRDDLQEEMHD